MMNSKMRYSLTKIWRGKGKNLIFHCICFNIDSSVTVKGIDMKFRRVLLHTYSEGTLSQISCSGLSLYFILFRK